MAVAELWQDSLPKEMGIKNRGELNGSPSLSAVRRGIEPESYTAYYQIDETSVVAVVKQK